MIDEPRFLDRYAPVQQHRNRLPHWQQDGATYFVTFRLADSLPAALLEKWGEERDAWLRSHSLPLTAQQELQLQRRFSRRVECWLDQAHGSCVLRDPDFAQFVADVLQRFDRVRYHQHSWVVMPNHVHALFSLAGGQTLQKTMQTWKGVSSRELNARCGRSGTLWQRDYFDTMIRNTEHFWRCAKYVRRNPEKAKVQKGAFMLYESPEVKEVLDGAATLLSPGRGKRD